MSSVNQINPDAIFTSLRSRTMSVKNSTKITKSVSFFNTPLRKQQDIEYNLSSISDALSNYGLISSGNNSRISKEQIGPYFGIGTFSGQAYGYSVSLSADGNTMAVGGGGIVDGYIPYPNTNHINGAVWIYTRIGSNWSYQETIYNEGTGSSISLSADGNTLAIGCYGNTDGFVTNVAYIYIRTNGSWAMSQSFTFSITDPTVNVSTSGDGNTVVFALINAPGFFVQTSILVYVKSGTSWVQYGSELTASFNEDGVDTETHLPITISSDGSTIAVSASSANQNGGQTAIFVRDGFGTWVQQGGFLTSSGISAREGFSNALSSNGDILVTGAPYANSLDGVVYVYIRNTIGVWSSGTALPDPGLAGSQFGSSVSISANGNVIVVGGFRDGGDVGAVWTYYRNGLTYELDNKFRGSGNLNKSYRGYSISISADASTMVFGGPEYNPVIGAIWVYVVPSGVRENVPETNKLIISDSFFNTVSTETLDTESLLVTDKLSFFSVTPSVQLSAISSINSILNVLQTYGLASTQNVWKLSETPLVGTNGTYSGTVSSLQGTSVALSFNGETAVVGGPNYNNNTLLGSIWIFIKIKGLWTQQIGPLWDNTAPGISNQGYSVSISSNGNTVAVGGPSFDPDHGSGFDPRGAAYVYIRTGNIWSNQSGPLVATGTGVSEATGQGRAVSLSENGDILLVSGNTKLIGSAIGAIWFYNRTGSIWTEVDGPIQPIESSEVVNFGWSAALSGDGSTAVVGDPEWNGTGAIWIYKNSTPGTPGGWLKTAGPLTSPTSLGNYSNQGISVCISRDGSTVGVGSSIDYNNRGAIYIYYKNNGVWDLQAGPLIGSAPTTGSLQGSSISMSSDGNKVVIGGSGNNADAGAYWTFIRTNGIWTQSGIQISPSGEASIKFGSSVAISADGNNVLIGSLQYEDTGAAFNATAVV